MTLGCSCARSTDEYHGFYCTISGGACVYLIPDSKSCAEDYGEGPDVVKYQNKVDDKDGK